MRFTHLIPVAVLALAVACTENAPNPADPSVPQFARARFIGDRNCTQVGSNLLCDFKVAGLGNISTATVTVQASATQQNVPVSNGQITVTDFVVSGGRCPDQFNPTFSGNATLIINGQVVGTIPIT